MREARWNFAFFARAAGLVGSVLLGAWQATAEPGVRHERVLAIGGAVTEIVYALGEQDRLVGRDSTSTYPPEAFALPDVGYIRALSPEGVLSVNPQLVLARENNGPPEAVEVLKSTGIVWVDVPDDFSPTGLDDNVRIIADALGVQQEGEALRVKIAGDLADVARATERIASPKRAMFILSIRNGRILVGGRDTAADGILSLAGTENVFAELEGYKPVSSEAILAAEPEVILAMTGRGRGGSHSASDDAVTSHPALSLTPAVADGLVIRMEGLYLLGFGPRTAEAALELAQRIYGDALAADAAPPRERSPGDAGG
ncbi:MAG: hemin ABC transporter substrate-binding protein [Myxococcota bacterium]